LQLLLGAIGALPHRSSWKLGLMLSIQDAQAFGKELTEAVADITTSALMTTQLRQQVEIDVLGVREEGQGAIVHAATTAVIDIKTQNILIDVGHGTIITSCVWHRRQTHRPDCHRRWCQCPY
jgi:hypothetical protein